MRLPDEELCLRLLREICTPPTAPYHEDAARDAVLAELARLGVDARQDRWGNVLAERSRGAAEHALALVAHLDHPALEVVEARGRTGRARIRGALLVRQFPSRVPLLVQRPAGAIRGVATEFVLDIEEANSSPGHVRVEAEAELRVGDWAILDLPAFARDGDDVRLRAADDLAGCALMLAVLHLLADEARPYQLYALFTRAEETGLFGARLAIEDRLLPPATIVVSIETSRALPGAEPRRGPVIRVGDAHHTFDDRGEAFLRIARERLAWADPPIAVQRQLMYGGDCEAGPFLDAGYPATAIALPVRNYHNSGSDGAAPEIISLSDFRGAAALLVEATVAAAEGAAESYRRLTGRVPDSIRKLLR